MHIHPWTGPVCFAMMVLFGLYLVYETWGWFRGNRFGLTPGQFRRRLAGGFLLLVVLAMGMLAGPLIGGRRPQVQLIYLLSATLLTTVAMLLAVRESAFVMRQYVRSHGSMLREMSRTGTSTDRHRDGPGVTDGE